jgi:hypothetical protein
VQLRAVLGVRDVKIARYSKLLLLHHLVACPNQFFYLPPMCAAACSLAGGIFRVLEMIFSWSAHVSALWIGLRSASLRQHHVWGDPEILKT